MDSTENAFAKELNSFTTLLSQEGLLGALRFLNKRTPHRYTGVYKYDGKFLKNIIKYDEFLDVIVEDEKVPLEVTYCSLVKDMGQLQILDATEDDRVKGVIETPVVSYGGVLIEDERNAPFGTLCHYDFKRCQERITDLPLLKLASSIIYQYIKLQNKI